MDSLGSEHTTSPPAQVPHNPITPPPWCVQSQPLSGYPEGRPRTILRAGTDPHAPIIAHVYCAWEWQDGAAEREANARLMAASPQLAAALRDLVTFVDRGQPCEEPDSCEVCSPLQAAYEALDAAGWES